MKKYNIWHVEMYAGWSDCDGPSDCNIRKDYIFDESFSKRNVISMLESLHTEDRVVEVWKCEKVGSGTIPEYD